ncbi:c6 zinc finger domain containing protein [Niveomyces insectorum RCEF 264]|uniref:C6 zinc finger domain containing protein n=1 Tax=Niveomyces insectorum RCEF 264 TaxID=1081102 RepID=A0A167XNW7_9HYPO|nr:c6 zinc finger domain containing protein [Niveomyces insectorum RCEF 264]
MDNNEGEVSDGMSENEYDGANLQLLREGDANDNDMDEMSERKRIKTEAAVGDPKKKYDPKDPLRPRRKKARRACFACQRAHLTCGDERPCQRCIKRGLAEGCQDGVRKKAKYLHDAPAEALRPVLGPSFSTNTASVAPSRSNGHRHPSSAGSDVSASNVTSFYSHSSAPAYPVFTTAQTPTGTLTENLTFPGSQSPVSPSFAPPSSDGNAAQLGRMGLSSTNAGLASFSPALFDPSNPALFNFNLEGINFGSQYAAMEFGMLGHMSSGAADDLNDPSSSFSQRGSAVRTGSGVGGFGPADVFANGGVDQTFYDGSGAGGVGAGTGGLMNDFMNLDASGNGFYAQGNLQHGLPHAYAIAAAPASLQSPSTDNNSPQATNYGYESSPTAAAYGIPGLNNGNGNSAGQSLLSGGAGGRSSISQQSQQPTPQQSLQQTPQQQSQLHHPKAKSSAVSKSLPQSILGKRHRDPSSVYEMVKEPYTYVTGFHRLIALLHRRFSANKIYRIAKALSSIRPSFISCTRTLNRQDLVFMEKCFQRTLFEYEEFMNNGSSPAIVCRRTGEIAAVNKEFTALTGWSKDVLLGKAPNLNVNTGTVPGSSGGTGGGGGGSVSGTDGGAHHGGSNTNSGRAGLSTPRMRALNPDALKAAEGKPQPLFLAELMDDDNVIEFYEDFAHLAFGDSRGSVNRKCRLLKYRTREVLDGSAAGSVVDEPQGGGTTSSNSHNKGSILSSRVARIDGEHGISKIERDGKLECSYCWHIRRDTFDIPMMIVMNFLPCYYPNQEPSQLAV